MQCIAERFDEFPETVRQRESESARPFDIDIAAVRTAQRYLRNDILDQVYFCRITVEEKGVIGELCDGEMYFDTVLFRFRHCRC